jgi:hypothetical protein
VFDLEPECASEEQATSLEEDLIINGTSFDNFAMAAY